jgi:hypothetical protein
MAAAEPEARWSCTRDELINALANIRIEAVDAVGPLAGRISADHMADAILGQLGPSPLTSPDSVLRQDLAITPGSRDQVTIAPETARALASAGIVAVPVALHARALRDALRACERDARSDVPPLQAAAFAAEYRAALAGLPKEVRGG